MSDKLDIEGIKALLATHANPSTALHLDAASETNIDEMLRHVKRAAEEAAIPLLAAMVAEVEALRKELKNTRELCAINGEVADDALDEVERLQRERSEWCDRADVLMTEHMTQLRDLLAEVAALRERLTLTPEKVEAAAQVLCNKVCHWSWTEVAHAALLAAGLQEKEQE